MSHIAILNLEESLRRLNAAMVNIRSPRTRARLRHCFKTIDSIRVGEQARLSKQIQAANE